MARSGDGARKPGARKGTDLFSLTTFKGNRDVPRLSRPPTDRPRWLPSHLLEAGAASPRVRDLGHRGTWRRAPGAGVTPRSGCHEPKRCNDMASRSSGRKPGAYHGHRDRRPMGLADGSGQRAFSAVPEIVALSAAPRTVWPAEEDDCKSSIPGGYRGRTARSIRFLRHFIR